MSKAISRRDFMKVTGVVGAAGLLAACGGNSSSTAASSSVASAPAASADESLALSDGPVSMTISWWGGDSRHEAYQNAIKEFQAEHSNITIEPTFAAWSGWEEKMAAAFIAGNAQDVCQVNWNWLYNYSADGSKFVDLNTVSNFLDLTQWDKAAMDACYVANSQQCVPVSMTGRIFFWNMTTFNKAGITEVPKTLDDLMAAGKAFQDKLGADYYPMHLGAYDRMILMVFYLESKYGKDWADPVTSTLNYTEDEIAEGLSFIKSLVDGHVMMNLKDYYSANSDTATHQSNEWITGKIAGIFEWDSAATKYSSALDDDNKDGFTVGEEIKFGDYNGGFSKVSMGLAITKTCEHVAEAATLIQFLLNEEKGASIMGSECGIPASKAGLGYAQAAGAVKDLVADANAKVMAFTTNKLDPLFENNDLKASGTGIYQEVFDNIDYGDEIKFGDYNGGFSKVSMGLAITKTCAHPAEAATLINFLLNEEEGASIMGSECGIPASKAGLAAAQAAGAVKELVAEANGKVMAFVSNQLDPLFESNDLKATGTGVYQEVFDSLDYDNVSGADLVDTLLDGMDAVGYTV